MTTQSTSLLDYCKGSDLARRSAEEDFEHSNQQSDDELRERIKELIKDDLTDEEYDNEVRRREYLDTQDRFVS